MPSTGLIVVDWGSSCFRAHLLNHDGKLLDSVFNKNGIFSADSKDFETRLFSACDNWLALKPGVPIIMCGMIGSCQGWLETPYVDCPASIESICRGLCVVPNEHDHPVYLIPGVIGCSHANLPDVMRGEETQILGVQDSYPGKDLTICLPGTHSKWALVQGNCLEKFSTFMTGELYGLLKSSGSVGVCIESETHNEADFLEGIAISQVNTDLLHQLFSVRSRHLRDPEGIQSPAAYLSGLLIGNEINLALASYSPTSNLVIVGNDSLSEKYRLALSKYRQDIITIPSETAILQGVKAVASMAGLVDFYA